MASVLVRRVLQRAAAERRHAALTAAEPAWVRAHRRAVQAQLLRRHTDPLWFGQALSIQFLAAQIGALELALGDDGSETVRRVQAARGRPAWQMVALAKRLCLLARVPSVGAFLQAGRVPAPWGQVLVDLGLASLTRAQRIRLLAPVAHLEPDVQDALRDAAVSARLLHALARLPVAAQRAALRDAAPLAPAGVEAAIWTYLRERAAGGDAPGPAASTRTHGRTAPWTWNC